MPPEWLEQSRAGLAKANSAISGHVLTNAGTAGVLDAEFKVGHSSPVVVAIDSDGKIVILS